MTQVHDIYNTINLHSLTYRKLFMQSRLSSLSKQKGMIKDDFNVSWYEVSATNTSLFDRSIVPVCPFNSLQSQMSSIFLNGWDPAGILKNLTPELVRFSQSTTQQVGILSRAVMVARDVTHRVYLTFSFKATFLFNCIIYLIFILVFCRLSVDWRKC